MSRLPRTRMTDIARAAGVSIATVDRVVNERAGVRAATAERVWDAVQRLGELSVRRPGGPVTGRHFGFLLPSGAGPSIEENLHGAIGDVAQDLGLEASRRFLERINPGALAEAIRVTASEGCDGIAIVMPVEHVVVRDAIEAAAAAGIRVVSLLSDVSTPGRVGYVGIDNRAAGRTAGYLMGRFLRGLRGRVAIFAGSPLYRSHEEREMGFRSVLRAEFPSLEVLDHALGLDEPSANHEAAIRLLEEHADLVGIYGIGSGNRGLVQALREVDRLRDVTLITHNLTDTSRRHLLDGAVDAVIHQDMRRIAGRAMRILADQRPHGAPQQHLVPFEIVVRESLPA